MKKEKGQERKVKGSWPETHTQYTRFYIYIYTHTHKKDKEEENIYIYIYLLLLCLSCVEGRAMARTGWGPTAQTLVLCERLCASVEFIPTLRH